MSLRHVEDLLAERGIDVSFQTVSEWAAKFGSEFAALLRRRSKGGFADKWHLDEMVVTIKGRKYGSVAKIPFVLEIGEIVFSETFDERFQVASFSGRGDLVGSSLVLPLWGELPRS
ncbi:hypothetical protein RvVAR0630_pl01030 (plasmid) [Agrobacterium vitis]|nr:hypothetical protein RvVAR0630_pl01030 [Agrobacterium vitis]